VTIDLDKLEALATATERSPASCWPPLVASVEDRAFEEAVGPATVLALVKRVRELEAEHNALDRQLRVADDDLDTAKADLARANASVARLQDERDARTADLAAALDRARKAEEERDAARGCLRTLADRFTVKQPELLDRCRRALGEEVS
jgi:chromosome segregation ATPase